MLKLSPSHLKEGDLEFTGFEGTLRTKHNPPQLRHFGWKGERFLTRVSSVGFLKARSWKKEVTRIPRTSGMTFS
jgi:hypothetical protein